MPLSWIFGILRHSEVPRVIRRRADFHQQPRRVAADVQMLLFTSSPTVSPSLRAAAHDLLMKSLLKSPMVTMATTRGALTSPSSGLRLQEHPTAQVREEADASSRSSSQRQQMKHEGLLIPIGILRSLWSCMKTSFTLKDVLIRLSVLSITTGKRGKGLFEGNKISLKLWPCVSTAKTKLFFLSKYNSFNESRETPQWTHGHLGQAQTGC